MEMQFIAFDKLATMDTLLPIFSALLRRLLDRDCLILLLHCDIVRHAITRAIAVVVGLAPIESHRYRVFSFHPVERVLEETLRKRRPSLHLPALLHCDLVGLHGRECCGTLLLLHCDIVLPVCSFHHAERVLGETLRKRRPSLHLPALLCRQRPTTGAELGHGKPKPASMGMPTVLIYTRRAWSERLYRPERSLPFA